MAGVYVGLTMGNHSIASLKQENYRTFHINHFTFSLYFSEKVLFWTKLVDHTKSVKILQNSEKTVLYWNIFYKTGSSKEQRNKEIRNKEIISKPNWSNTL